jgi:hypothetical protein
VNERHGSAIEQLLAVLESLPSEATKVRCADASAASFAVDSMTQKRDVKNRGANPSRDADRHGFLLDCNRVRIGWASAGFPR